MFTKHVNKRLREISELVHDRLTATTSIGVSSFNTIKTVGDIVASGEKIKSTGTNKVSKMYEDAELVLQNSLTGFSFETLFKKPSYWPGWTHYSPYRSATVRRHSHEEELIRLYKKIFLYKQGNIKANKRFSHTFKIKYTKVQIPSILLSGVIPRLLFKTLFKANVKNSTPETISSNEVQKSTGYCIKNLIRANRKVPGNIEVFLCKLLGVRPIKIGDLDIYVIPGLLYMMGLIYYTEPKKFSLNIPLDMLVSLYTGQLGSIYNLSNIKQDVFCFMHSDNIVCQGYLNGAIKRETRKVYYKHPRLNPEREYFNNKCFIDTSSLPLVQSIKGS